MILCSGRSLPVYKDILPYSEQKTIQKLHKIKEMTVVTRSYVDEHGDIKMADEVKGLAYENSEN